MTAVFYSLWDIILGLFVGYPKKKESHMIIVLYFCDVYVLLIFCLHFLHIIFIFALILFIFLIFSITFLFLLFFVFLHMTFTLHSNIFQFYFIGIKAVERRIDGCCWWTAAGRGGKKFSWRSYESCLKFRWC